MSSLQTPLHKVQGLGASHSGTGHFWRERVTSVALIPLSVWFAYAILGLAGTNEVAVVSFLAHPWNAILMAVFVVTSFYHLSLGLTVVIDDYVHGEGTKLLLRLLVTLFWIAASLVGVFALVRIAAL